MQNSNDDSESHYYYYYYYYYYGHYDENVKPHEDYRKDNIQKTTQL